MDLRINYKQISFAVNGKNQGIAFDEIETNENIKYKLGVTLNQESSISIVNFTESNIVIDSKYVWIQYNNNYSVDVHLLTSNLIMSSKTNTFTKIDNETKYTVFGYIRRCENILKRSRVFSVSSFQNL